MAEDTYLRRFLSQVQLTPDSPACGFITEGGVLAKALTYLELDHAARHVADLLSAWVAPGARVMVVAETSPEFVSAFFGCMYVGVIAVPVAPPGNPRFEVGADRIRRVIRDCGAELMLASSRATANEYRPHFSGIRIVHPGAAGDGAHSWRIPRFDGRTVAFLQYTSGSTETPRGVVVDQSNLAANISAIDEVMGLPPAATSVSWLPLFHDMGLIGALLGPLSLGGAVYLLRPENCLKRPIEWLQAVQRFGGHISGGPNFAYEWLLAKTTDEQAARLDLSGWQMAFSGAEPVRPDTLRRFAERFGRSGLRPESIAGCYGLAEATLLVSGGPVDRHELRVDRAAMERGQVVPVTRDSNALRLAPVGRVPTGHRLEIVDEAGVALADDVAGEIWVSSASVARGYWGQGEQSAAVFGARLSSGDSTPFLRTGDLGFRHDGQLYICGRIKDLLVVRGRNVQPHDVENSVCEAVAHLVPGGGAAFHLDDQRIALVAETTVSDPEVLPAVAAEARRVALEKHELPLAAVRLVRRRQLPRTSSGKVRRSACRQLMLDGQLKVLFEADLCAD